MRAEQLLNQILPEKPVLSGDVYAPVMPKWTVSLLRLISLGVGGASLWLGGHDWANIPLFFKVIVVVVGFAMLFAALHPKGWAMASASPYFLADKSGIYFPHHDAHTTFLGSNNSEKQRISKTWLFLPWDAIVNIRTAKVISSDGTSNAAVFDIPLNTENVTEYLYDNVKDKAAASGMRTVFLCEHSAYGKACCS